MFYSAYYLINANSIITLIVIYILAIYDWPVSSTIAVIYYESNCIFYIFFYVSPFTLLINVVWEELVASGGLYSNFSTLRGKRRIQHVYIQKSHCIITAIVDRSAKLSRYLKSGLIVN